MANYKKEVNTKVTGYIAQALKDRCNELGLTRYRIIRDDPKFSIQSAQRLFSGKDSYNVNTLAEWLDKLGLEIRIVKKDEGCN